MPQMPIDNAIEATCEYKLVENTGGKHEFTPSDTPGTVTIDDFPFKEARTNAQNLTHFFDVIRGADGAFDYKAIKNSVGDGNFDALPGPLHTQVPMALGKYHLQCAIIPKDDNKVDIIKAFSFVDQKVSHRQIAPLIRGELKVFDWDGRVPAEVRKGTQFLFHALGGFQFTTHFLKDCSRPAKATSSHELDTREEKRLLTEDEINKGFEFILAASEQQMTKFQLLRWIKVQQNSRSSPVFGWSKMEIADMFRTLKDEGDLSSLLTAWPLTLYDVAPFLREVVRDILKNFAFESLLLLGYPGSGKTPLATCMGRAHGHYKIKKDKKLLPVGVRIAQDLDFFRGQPGSEYHVDILDDAHIPGLEPVEFEAFTGVRAREAMVRARWGASKFHGPRIGCDNTFDPSIKINKELGMDLETFLQLIAPCFKRGFGEPNVLAVLKRATVVVNTETHVVIKFAGKEEITILDIPGPVRGCYLAEGALDKLEAHKETGKLPDDFRDAVKNELALMRSLHGDDDEDDDELSQPAAPGSFFEAVAPYGALPLDALEPRLLAGGGDDEFNDALAVGAAESREAAAADVAEDGFDEEMEAARWLAGEVGEADDRALAAGASGSHEAAAEVSGGEAARTEPPAKRRRASELADGPPEQDETELHGLIARGLAAEGLIVKEELPDTPPQALFGVIDLTVEE